MLDRPLSYSWTPERCDAKPVKVTRKITLAVYLLLNLIVRSSPDGGRDERSQNSATVAAARDRTDIRALPPSGAGRRCGDAVPGHHAAMLSRGRIRRTGRSAPAAAAGEPAADRRRVRGPVGRHHRRSAGRARLSAYNRCVNATFEAFRAVKR